MTSCSLLLIVAAITAVQGQAAPITATTGAPAHIDTGGTGTTFAMSEADYQRFVDRVASTSPEFVPIVKKPAELSPRAQFGINLVLRDKNLSWVVDGDETEGYVFYADWNGNGDLTDETPMRFEKIDGMHTIRVQREEKDGPVTYPVTLKLMLEWLVPPTKTEKQLALKNYNRTTRTGEIAAPGGRSVTFRLSGTSGFYNEPFHTVAFDLDGDGAFNADREVFRVKEKSVNIGGTSYEFAVDRHGSSLTLTPMAVGAARVALTAGSPAPDFSFTSIDGRQQKLSDYRGKVVLLDFWGAWCAPCVADAPKLVAAYEKYRDRGFEIIGIDTLDTRENMLEFIRTHKMVWTQTMEADEGPIQTLYRINGFPSYFIVGADGIIKVGASGSNIDLDKELSAIFKVEGSKETKNRRKPE